jgi:lipoprotein NlpD
VKVNHQKEKLILFIVTSGLLLGCSHNLPAPVYDLSNTNSTAISHSEVEVVPSDYTVLPGDTLFSIAWYHSVDYEELAEINQLKNNLIYPGQKLSFAKSREKKYFDSESLMTAIHNEVLNKKYRLSSQNTKQLTTKKNKYRAKQKPKQPINSVVQFKNKPQTVKSKSASDKSLNWIWPTDGKILTRFSTRTNASKGLDIDAAFGQPVRATAPGRVVYQGSGLRGYGNLVIIKHSDNYLSAYAHNNKIHVAENEMVKSGQKIADVGSSGTQGDKLHFEIRYKGKPVDPLNYLPQRNF